jgi:clorobiocin biosynthesis protein CloN7
MKMGPPDDSAPPRTTDPAEVGTSDRFFGHGLLPVALYRPDFTALETAPARVVVAGGSTSEGEFAHRTAAALADRLGTRLVAFPGGHGGFASDPAEFVAVLRRTLT